MKIILNADDFGWSEETVEATIALFEMGAITSATIMPKMPATPAAVAYATTHQQFSFGVHLTLSGDGPETCLSAPAEIPALALPDGRFRQTASLGLKALLGRVPAAEIEHEVANQLSAMADSGLPLSHVDSHGNLHKFGPFREALKHTLPRFGIQRVRNVQNVYCRNNRYFTPTYWFGSIWRRRLMAAFATTQYFYLPASTADAAWGRAILYRFHGDEAAGQSLEIGVHPGRSEQWRKQEMEAASAFARQARSQGHQLVTWRDI